MAKMLVVRSMFGALPLSPLVGLPAPASTVVAVPALLVPPLEVCGRLTSSCWLLLLGGAFGAEVAESEGETLPLSPSPLIESSSCGTRFERRRERLRKLLFFLLLLARFRFCGLFEPLSLPPPLWELLLERVPTKPSSCLMAGPRLPVCSSIRKLWMLGMPAVMSERLITISLMTTGALSAPVFGFVSFLGFFVFLVACFGFPRGFVIGWVSERSLHVGSVEVRYLPMKARWTMDAIQTLASQLVRTVYPGTARGGWRASRGGVGGCENIHQPHRKQ